MLATKGEAEFYAGSEPANSPTAQKVGVFSLCSGGVPINGAFGRIPGKSPLSVGLDTGGAMSIYQFGRKVVVQRYTGIEIFDITEISPQPQDYLYDNEGNLVYNNSNIPITVQIS